MKEVPWSRVLVIDDEPGIRNILRWCLEGFGYEVLLADDGLRGIGVARRQRTDAIVLDLMMPVMDGHTVLDVLRADEKTRHLPVIVLSALTQHAVKARCRAQGVASFIAKPFDPSDVAVALNDAPPDAPAARLVLAPPGRHRRPALASPTRRAA